MRLLPLFTHGSNCPCSNVGCLWRGFAFPSHADEHTAAHAAR